MKKYTELYDIEEHNEFFEKTYRVCVGEGRTCPCEFAINGNAEDCVIHMY